jgi:hypothetical protein
VEAPEAIARQVLSMIMGQKIALLGIKFADFARESGDPRPLLYSYGAERESKRSKDHYALGVTVGRLRASLLKLRPSALPCLRAAATVWRVSSLQSLA